MTIEEVSLVERGDFNENNIKRSNLTISLATEALRSGIVSSQEYSAFENALFDALAERIHEYTGGRSDSVESETALRLLGSILYASDLALSGLSLKNAVNVIFTTDLSALCAIGERKIREYQLKALSALRRLKRSRINLMCVYYNDLISRDLEKYIKTYDARFDAGRGYTHVDYNLPTVNRAVRGIGGLLHILEELQKEADFVNSFPREQTKALFSRYLSELAHPAGDMPSLGQLCFEHAALSLAAGDSSPEVPLSADAADKLVFADKDAAQKALLSSSQRLRGHGDDAFVSKLSALSMPFLSSLLTFGGTAVKRFAGIPV